ncbi:DUF1003 domain-containing protein [Euzebya sp.]|uniref:DUF1003 domain-containing protein n=1 Tax=Euzebya sp. TaxID=1971409 RepID=UPI003519067E
MSRDLSAPRGTRRRVGVFYDQERFGRFSEAIANFLGTATYLVAQTVVVIVWVVINIVAVRFRWDPYPFILLNLFFSTQASYAAPLILLAQNRQADRDRAQAERDRRVGNRTLSDTEYLARELAAVRVAVTDVAEQRNVGRDLRALTDAVEQLTARVEAVERRVGGS